MIQLGVNIDHVATLRQARRGVEPDPVHAAVLAEMGGADGITLHLREDRRHVQERDLRVLRETVHVWVNLEMALDPGVLAIACEVKPDQACLVPERREELTTEGGLVVAGREDEFRRTVDRLREAGIRVTFFLDPDIRQIEAAHRSGAHMVELNTGEYSNARGPGCARECLERLQKAGSAVRAAGMGLHAGHGLDRTNIHPVLELPGLAEVNIGHAIVARAIHVGFERAVAEMADIVKRKGRSET
ncbi:MAG: pyridoxine 5'-phosphate synthase [Planctomycetes bacterium]|nr:pyridoxine 5'-phosphate synthase [Planctomycetota bacterium]